MTENIYSCFHYHKKCKEDREATEKAASEAKGYADSINPATLVNIGSGQTITGNKTFTKPIIARMNTVVENTPPAQNQYIDWISPCDKNGLGMGYLGVADYADGRRASRIGHTRNKSDGSKVYASIDVGTYKNGTVYTSAPNPPSNSNGAAIATTAWVHNNKATFVGWGMPDYSAGVAISNKTDFTCPKDGLVIAYGASSKQYRSWVKVNGVDFILSSYWTEVATPTNFVFPVGKGSVLHFDFTYNPSPTGINFYPYKGAN